MEAALDRGQDRRGVVLRVVDHELAPQSGHDRQCRDARAGAPGVVYAPTAALPGRRDVVPLPAELVVGHDHHRVPAAYAALDRLDQPDEVGAAARLARVAGVLVLGADRLDERDVSQAAASPRPLRDGDELLLVAEMAQPRAGRRPFAGVTAARVPRVVVEGLVVVL